MLRIEPASSLMQPNPIHLQQDDHSQDFSREQLQDQNPANDDHPHDDNIQIPTQQLLQKKRYSLNPNRHLAFINDPIVVEACLRGICRAILRKHYEHRVIVNEACRHEI